MVSILFLFSLHWPRPKVMIFLRNVILNLLKDTYQKEQNNTKKLKIRCFQLKKKILVPNYQFWQNQKIHKIKKNILKIRWLFIFPT